MNYKHSLYIICTSIALIATSWVWFAAARYDCSLVIDGVQKAASNYQNQTANTLYDKQTITLALQHLSDYCCKKWYIQWETACTGIENRKWWAESPYIFDHLIDLWFRRLDAAENATLRYNLPADTVWAEWQAKIKTFNNPESLTKPNDIVTTYNSTKFWQETNTKSIIERNCVLSNETYNSLSLYDRYKVACDISVCIAKIQPILGENSATTSVRRLETNPCDTLLASRKNTETAIVKQLLTRVWIRTITSIVEQYTNNYFVWTRWQNLYEQRASFDQSLTFVNRKIQEWTPVCSK